MGFIFLNLKEEEREPTTTTTTTSYVGHKTIWETPPLSIFSAKKSVFLPSNLARKKLKKTGKKLKKKKSRRTER